MGGVRYIASAVGAAAILTASIAQAKAETLQDALTPLVEEFVEALATRDLGGPTRPVDIYLRPPVHADHSVSCEPMASTLKNAFSAAFTRQKFAMGRSQAEFVGRDLVQDGDAVFRLEFRPRGSGRIEVRAGFGIYRGANTVESPLPSITVASDAFSETDRVCLFTVARNDGELIRQAERTLQIRRDLGGIIRRQNRIGFLRKGNEFILHGWVETGRGDYAIVERFGEDDPLAEVFGFAEIARPRPVAPLPNPPQVGIAPTSPQRQPTERYPDLSTFKDCPECPKMVVIPAGSFMMGLPEGEEARRSYEGPQHRREIAKFALAQTEVTFDQWAACARDGGCRSNPNPSDAGWGRGSRPVISVSWDDAQEYVGWLNGKVEGKPYRLPSEAEWEYAARAGTTTAYAFGNNITSAQANFGRNFEGGRSAPVGIFPGNDFRLHEMHGNVWEWVEDCWHDSYAGAPPDGRAWLSSQNGDCSRRVLRGGSWFDIPRFLNSAVRYWFVPEVRNHDYGFRPARILLTP